MFLYTGRLEDRQIQEREKVLVQPGGQGGGLDALDRFRIALRIGADLFHRPAREQVRGVIVVPWGPNPGRLLETLCQARRFAK